MDLVLLFDTPKPPQQSEPPEVEMETIEEEKKAPNRHPGCFITAEHPEHTFLRSWGTMCGGEAATSPVKVRVYGYSRY